MADLRLICAVGLTMMLLLSFLGSMRTLSKPVELVSVNATALTHTVYRGQWSAPPDTFGLLTETSGRTYFAAEQVNGTNFTAYFVIFDGEWEDDHAYTIVVRHSTYDDSARTLKLGANFSMFDYSEQVFIERNLQAGQEGQGSLFFNESNGIFSSEGHILQSGKEMELDLKEMTEDDVRDGKIAYSALFTAINFLTFWGFLRHLHFCVQSESYAKQTSLMFLGMNASMDLFLSLWHLRLALIYYVCFDYLVLASIWSFIVYILVQSRVVQVVWRAQNQDIISFVRGK
jgi:hypothetical protein